MTGFVMLFLGIIMLCCASICSVLISTFGAPRWLIVAGHFYMAFAAAMAFGGLIVILWS